MRCKLRRFDLQTSWRRSMLSVASREARFPGADDAVLDLLHSDNSVVALLGSAWISQPLRPGAASIGLSKGNVSQRLECPNGQISSGYEQFAVLLRVSSSNRSGVFRFAQMFGFFLEKGRTTIDKFIRQEFNEAESRTFNGAFARPSFSKLNSLCFVTPCSVSSSLLRARHLFIHTVKAARSLQKKAR